MFSSTRIGVPVYFVMRVGRNEGGVCQGEKLGSGWVLGVSYKEERRTGFEQAVV